MIKFGGFDKYGQALHIACITHRYSDLPMKGLGKSMESVGIDEPVIIPYSARMNTIIWDYTTVGLCACFALPKTIKLVQTLTGKMAY